MQPLNGFVQQCKHGRIYAGDGHYHAAAVHDKKKDGKKYPVQHFYSVDLRTNAYL